jgi:hypothetical protein
VKKGNASHKTRRVKARKARATKIKAPSPQGVRAITVGREALEARNVLESLSDGFVEVVSGQRGKQRFNRRRFVGPFWSGSDLGAIQVSISTGNPSWYFGDFFTTSASSSSYNYSFNNALPSGAAPVPSCIPGAFPSASGALPLTFVLFQIDYSSRYGGSVQLRFRLAESTGYELRKDSNLWDLGGLQLHVFVGVNPQTFRVLSLTNTPVSAELRYTKIQAYEIPAKVFGSAQLPPVALPTALRDVADTELRNLVLNVMTPQSGFDPARRFVIGYLRSLFPDILANSKLRVDGVCIADDQISFHTHEILPMVRVTMSVAAGLGLEDGGFAGLGMTFDAPEFTFELNISWSHVTSTGETFAIGSRATTIAGSEPGGDLNSTSAIVVGTWNPALDFDATAVRVTIHGAELDVVTANDRFGSVTFDLSLDRAAILSNVTSRTFGVVGEPQTMQVRATFVDGSEDTLNDPFVLLIVNYKVEVYGM